jgi:hypothetical protein
MSHFVTYAELRVALPMVANEFCVDQRENHAKPNTSHEVTAPRAVGPSGRTVFRTS